MRSGFSTPVCPRCGMSGGRSQMAPMGPGMGLPAMAARLGLDILNATVGMMNQGMMNQPARMGRSGSSCGCGCDCSCHSQKRRPCAPSRKGHATTDIQLEGRLGERRVVSLLVENNRSQDAQMTFSARPWSDAFGREVAGAKLELRPATATLKPGESVGIEAIVEVAQPLEDGMAYYTEITLAGCPTRPISVGLLVESRGCYAYYAVCDPCRRRHGRFVEFCQECGCDCGCDSCSTCCGCGGAAGCGCDHGCGCDWPGRWDPHHHWHDDCCCARLYLPPRIEQRQFVTAGSSFEF